MRAAPALYASTVKTVIDSRCALALMGPPRSFVRIDDGFRTYEMFSDGKEYDTPLEAAEALRDSLILRMDAQIKDAPLAVIWRTLPQVNAMGDKWNAWARAAFVSASLLPPEMDV